MSHHFDTDNGLYYKEYNTVCTPHEKRKPATTQTLDSLPERSRKNYETVYNTFIEWQLMNRTTSFSEDTLLVYFKDLTKKYKSSTLWCHYSMLKSNLNAKHGVNIEPYGRLRALLKRQSEGYQPKKSEALSGTDIKKFIDEAPDKIYLATKVALIMGVTGACRAVELYAMKLEDLKFVDGYILVVVPQAKNKLPRTFRITDRYYQIVKKYMELRPLNAASDHFFLNYQKGKCTRHKIGINKFGAMGKEIATFLKIENPGRFTGHCLRRSSATVSADEDACRAIFKRHGAEAEDCLAESKKNKMDASPAILTPIKPKPLRTY